MDTFALKPLVSFNSLFENSKNHHNLEKLGILKLSQNLVALHRSIIFPKFNNFSRESSLHQVGKCWRCYVMFWLIYKVNKKFQKIYYFLSSGCDIDIKNFIRQRGVGRGRAKPRLLHRKFILSIFRLLLAKCLKVFWALANIEIIVNY